MHRLGSLKGRRSGSRPSRLKSGSDCIIHGLAHSVLVYIRVVISRLTICSRVRATTKRRLHSPLQQQFSLARNKCENHTCVVCGVWEENERRSLKSDWSHRVEPRVLLPCHKAQELALQATPCPFKQSIKSRKRKEQQGIPRHCLQGLPLRGV